MMPGRGKFKFGVIISKCSQRFKLVSQDSKLTYNFDRATFYGTLFLPVKKKKEVENNSKNKMIPGRGEPIFEVISKELSNSKRKKNMT